MPLSVSKARMHLGLPSQMTGCFDKLTFEMNRRGKFDELSPMLIRTPHHPEIETHGGRYTSEIQIYSQLQLIFFSLFFLSFSKYKE